jgi:hypothetical protein
MNKQTELTPAQEHPRLAPNFDALIESRVRVEVAIRRSKGFSGSQKWGMSPKS